jgi:hypothetical protein
MQPAQGLPQLEATMRRVPIRSILTRSLLAGTLAATMAAGTALGHECFIASRSDTGTIAAGTHSRSWLYVGSLRLLFGFLSEEAGLPPLSPSQLDWAVDAAKAAGMPNEFSIFVGRRTIAEGTPAMDKHGADGRGVDHLGDWFPTAVEIYTEALAE